MTTRTDGVLKALALRAFLISCLGFPAASCRHKVAAVISAAPVGGPIVLPAGTVVAIIVAEMIDSSRPSENRAYAAVISRDIQQATPQTILPSGSPATLVLMPGNGGGAKSSWQLGLSSVRLNGDSFLIKQNGESGAPIGAYLGGVPGKEYLNASKRQPGETGGLIVSESQMHIIPGSLLTFRVEKEIVLAGSGH